MSGMMLNFAGVTATSVPGAPTIGTATATGKTTATVAYTAPASNGGSVITSYTATSSPSGITGTLSQAGSGTITVSGLTANTAYTFTVTATNAIGQSAASAASNSITTLAVTCATFTSSGSYSWVAPSGVTSASAVVVSAAASPCGSGAAGDLVYGNGFAVTPGNTYTVYIAAAGAACTSAQTSLRQAFSPNNYLVVAGHYGVTTYCRGTAVSGFGNGNGGMSGGAGGYTGNGGGTGVAGSGGGGGGGGGQGAVNAPPYYNTSGFGGGGGVGIYGAGSNGAAGTGGCTTYGGSGGGGGSGGSSGTAGSAPSYSGGTGGNGGAYGGSRGDRGFSCYNCGCRTYGTRGQPAGGAVRIVWCVGGQRGAPSFPSTNVGP